MPTQAIQIDAARAAVLERCSPLGSERLGLEAALGRVLAEPVIALDDVPAFHNSAMDGFAVRASDTLEGAELEIAGESAAGHPWTGALNAGTAVAISTGAAIPRCADAVVRLEDTLRSGSRLRIARGLDPGLNVRRAADDMAAGAVVLEAGTELGAAEVGVAAAAGTDEVTCARRPRVHLLTSGDELQPAGEPLRPGGVRNANRYSVGALTTAAGAELVATETVGDSREAMEAALGTALCADVAVVCGGVSVGEHDHVKAALAALGVEEVFWRVALRPGKPTWFGVAPSRALVFGLPGNPVSAIVTFLVFVRPAIRAMLGASERRRAATAILDVDYAKADERAELVRCRLELRDDGWHARPTKDQGSHILTSMLGADALAILPMGRSGVSAGERVEFELIP